MAFNYIFVKNAGSFPLDVPQKYRKVMLFRATLGFWGMYGAWGAAQYIPLGVLTCIYATNAIWLSIWASCFLGENFTRIDCLALTSAFVGVIILNNPFD